MTNKMYHLDLWKEGFQLLSVKKVYCGYIPWSRFSLRFSFRSRSRSNYTDPNSVLDLDPDPDPDPDSDLDSVLDPE